MKPLHRRILHALQQGETLWRYSSLRMGQYSVRLANSWEWQRVRASTIEDMVEAGLIEEDVKRSVYRESGSDIHYIITNRA